MIIGDLERLQFRKVHDPSFIKKGIEEIEKKVVIICPVDKGGGPIIYSLPKIHKDKENPPGRPIINGIGSVCSRLGQYIDWFLQPQVKKAKAFFKDTKHIIQLLRYRDSYIYYGGCEFLIHYHRPYRCHHIGTMGIGGFRLAL